jgi:GNAT superfamily N-acetyltransferase
VQNASDYEISTDKNRLDVGLIHEFLTSSYWAKGVPRSVIEKSLKNSLCFGAYRDGRQVGFGRAVTDLATFAYIADVFVLPEHRGRGVARSLIKAMLSHPELQGLRRFLLATDDAHKLYAQCGFQPLSQPDRYMTIHDPDVYQKSQQ